MRITWEHTVIGGKIAPEDFFARDEKGRSIGRAYWHHSGLWLWAFQAHGPDIVWPTTMPATGTTDTKQEAADAVRDMFGRCWRP